MKQPIRFFSIGLITASIVVFIVITLVDKPETTIQDNMNIDEMIESIKDEGYHVLSSSEYISLSAKKEENEDDQNTNKETNNNKDNNADTEKDKEKPSEKENEENEEDQATSYTLEIKQNMLGPEISELLAKNKIIGNADDFNRYLETEGYAPYIQLGTFKLKSDMNNNKIAEKIARKK